MLELAGEEWVIQVNLALQQIFHSGYGKVRVRARIVAPQVAQEAGSGIKVIVRRDSMVKGTQVFQ